MRRLVPLLPLILTACPPEEAEDPFDISIDADDVDGYIVESSGGPTPHDVTVRAVNSFGAAVSATSADLQVGTSARSVLFDTYGFGSFSVETAGAYDVTGAQSEGATVYGFDADFSGLGWATAAEVRDDAREVIPVDGGFLIRGNTQLWWAEPGARPVPLVAMTDSIGGVYPCQLDFDGTTDVVVWAGSTLALLKGRPDGGMAWAGGLLAPGSESVAAAACGDATGDFVGDLVIGWSDASGDPSVMVLSGDGLWDFDLYDELYIEDTPTSISIGDNAGTMRGQISVFTDGNDLVRYSISDNGSIYETGPNLQGTLFPESPKLLPGMDLNGDGFDELVLVGLYTEGAERELQIWDLAGDVPFRTNVDREGGHVAWGDADGDGLFDIITVSDDLQVSTITFDGDELIQHFVGETKSHGLIGVSDVDDDGVAEFLLADSDRWTFWNARLAEATNDLDEPYDQYRLDSEEGVEVEGGMTGVVATGELDGNDATAEWVHADANTFEVMGVDASGEAIQWGTVGLTDASFTDAALCGSEAWVLGTTQLARVDLSNPAAPVVTEVPIADGIGVSCQPGEGMVFTSSTATVYDGALAEVMSESTGGAVDAALVRYDGATSEVVTCTSANCAIAVLDNADGSQISVIGDGRTLTWSADTSSTDLAGSGVPYAQDVDGDGNEDAVVVLDDHVIAVHLNSGGALAPAWGYHRGEGVALGPVFAVDLDGDGSRDLAVHDGEGSWWVSPAPAAEPDEEDTGDTGSESDTDIDTGESDTDTAESDTETGETGSETGDTGPV